MKYKSIEISPLFNSSKPYLCEMSEKLRQHLGLPKNLSSLKISCGMHTVTCPIVIINKERLCLSISDQTLHELNLPIHTFFLKGKLVDPHQLQLGPVVGLLTEIKNTNLGVRFGTIHEFCKELALYCEANGIFFYIFSLSTYSKKHLMGFIHHQNEWIETEVPYPDVVHNRIHSRKLERSKTFLQVTAELVERNVPYFNDRFLNKWEVHQILAANEHLIPYLPKSRLLETKADLMNMLADTKDLIIKPINGSQGKRIFRIIEKENGAYLLDYTTFSGEIKKEYDTFQQLFSTLYPKLKREGFLLQETIQLQNYQNRTLDFRFLCHKKDFQKWKVSSAVARVSADNQFVANLARGGELFQLKEVINELYGESDSHHLRKLLAELSLEIVNVICLHAGGEFGEFGIDLALDQDGHPWIIEVNTKPSKSEDSQNTTKIRPSTRAILNYCLFLSQFEE
ncbi:YheC/YheD family protein [Metabacillus sediminilitoris]|uniref:YheC/YheD family protein n=1 Tax=Metabacillus sediminilitoris TaxID=2567941 RepID=A0A4S4BY15_9BACI|nr:YheC/YheD family protein [Metabacillus sediminilitoris]QGQ44507.1 YheC/YheD family protein [Metabacillus sediminilitoris]THF80131.1 YheC/YheD family protein [Metabacillus sediminilitoris]